jgi:hypothetical protein
MKENRGGTDAVGIPQFFPFRGMVTASGTIIGILRTVVHK